MESDVIVIGSGIGGLACGALLAREGHKVDVFERSSYPGGRCGASQRDGMLIENFAHIFPLGSKGSLGRVANKIGEEIDFITHDPSALIYDFYRGKLRILSLPRNMNKLTAQAKLALSLRIRPASLVGGGLLFAKLLFGSYAGLKKYDNITLKEFLEKYIHDQQLTRLMNTLCYMMFTVPYEEASAGEFIYCFRKMFKAADISYPRGSSAAITEAFIRGLEKCGGRIHLESPVEKITGVDGVANGVIVNGKAIESDIIVSNAGISTTAALAGPELLGKEYVEWSNGLQYSYSGVIGKYYLKRQVVDAPAIIYMPDSKAEDMFSFLRKGNMPEDNMIMLLVVDRMDPGLLPEGKQLLIAAAPGPASPGNELNAPLLEWLDERLFSLFPEIRDHVIWKEELRPEHISRATGRKNSGDSVGLAQVPGQVGKNKPSQATPLKGLFLVGADAGARGIGTDQVAASAEAVVDLVKKSMS